MLQCFVLFYFCLQMKEALSEIIQLATVDSEPWVLMVADILKSFPETGSLNLDLEEQNPNVQDILGELREKGRGSACFVDRPKFLSRRTVEYVS